MGAPPLQNFDVHFFRRQAGGWTARIEWTDENGKQCVAFTDRIASEVVLDALSRIDITRGADRIPDNTIEERLFRGIRPPWVKDEP